MMRIGYLGFRISHVNPIPELVVEVLRGHGQLFIYGPGYSSQDVLDRGVAEFILQNGPFDILVFDDFVLMQFDPDPNSKRNRFTYFACDFDRSALMMAIEIRGVLAGYGGVRVMSVMNSDYYNIGSYQVDLLHELADYYITWGEEFVSSPEYIDPMPQSAIGVDADILKTCTSQYLKFVRQNKEKIISFPYYVASAELYSRPIDRRSTAWSVMGAEYGARVTAKKILDEAGIARSGRWVPWIFPLADKIGVNLYAHHWSIQLLRWAFNRALRDSRYSYTCGSAIRWPVRKFFEIPANGCVLVAAPCSGFNDLGFVHESTALACQPDDILDADAWLRADSDRARKIAQAGHALVARHHTVEARTRQLRQCLQAICAGTFRGSRWQNGAYVIDCAPTLSPLQGPVS